MRPIFSTLIAFFLVGGLATAAQAEAPATVDGFDPAHLADLSTPQLDQAFEASMAKAGEAALLRFGGPTQMLCETGAGAGGAETCVVTAPALGDVVPAALAQR